MKEYRTREIYGDFYEKEGKPLAVIIGGSRPGLPAPILNKFLDYMKQNFQVLLLAYFGAGELPKSLEQVPLEYFTGAIQRIQEEYGIPDRKVLVIGQSKGAEAALLLTRYIASAVTIALVPSCYVFQGLPDSTDPQNYLHAKSSWTYAGQELPYIKFHFDKPSLQAIMKNEYCRCYEASIEKNDNPDAVIQVDSYSGKILFLSEENDRYWPSKKMTETLIERSRNKQNMEHITLDLESHRLMNEEVSVEEIITYLNKYAINLK